MIKSFPFIEVAGPPHVRGVIHGRAARQLIEGGLDLYRELFTYYGRLSWDDALATASRYGPVVKAFNPEGFAEIAGVAEGCGRTLEELLALNCRSELLWQEAETDFNPLAVECTSFGITADGGGQRHVLIGQNWDWLIEAQQNTILLGIQQDPLPAIILLTEAGMIGRFGMNSAGVALATNTLISRRPRQGVPYNLVLRSILNQSGAQAAAALVAGTPRAVAANYLLGDAAGVVMDIETTPEQHGVLEPEDGVLTHANNFRISELVDTDRGASLLPDSERRYSRLAALLLAGTALTDVGSADFGELLADHDGFPSSICRHPDPDRPWQEQIVTAASIVMDPVSRRLWVAPGNPCVHPWEEVEWPPLSLRSQAAV